MSQCSDVFLFLSLICLFMFVISCHFLYFLFSFIVSLSSLSSISLISHCFEVSRFLSLAFYTFVFQPFLSRGHFLYNYFLSLLFLYLSPISFISQCYSCSYFTILSLVVNLYFCSSIFFSIYLLISFISQCFGVSRFLSLTCSFMFSFHSFPSCGHYLYYLICLYHLYAGVLYLLFSALRIPSFLYLFCFYLFTFPVSYMRLFYSPFPFIFPFIIFFLFFFSLFLLTRIPLPSLLFHSFSCSL